MGTPSGIHSPLGFGDGKKTPPASFCGDGEMKPNGEFPVDTFSDKRIPMTIVEGTIDCRYSSNTSSVVWSYKTCSYTWFACPSLCHHTWTPWLALHLS